MCFSRYLGDSLLFIHILITSRLIKKLETFYYNIHESNFHLIPMMVRACLGLLLIIAGLFMALLGIACSSCMAYICAYT